MPEPDAPSGETSSPASPVASSGSTSLPLEVIAALAGREQVPRRPSPEAQPPRDSPAKDDAEDFIHASGIYPAPSSPTPALAAASNDKQHLPGSTAGTLKMAVARRPLPTSAPNGSASSSTAPNAGPQSRPASAKSLSPDISTDLQENVAMVESDIIGTNLSGPSISTKTHNTATNDDNGVVDVNGTVSALEEIVVDNTTNLRHSPSVHIALDQQDVTMEGVGENNLEPPQSKRKRSPIHGELGEDNTERSDVNYEASRSWPAKTVPSPASHGASATTKTVPLGYWRDSTVPDVKERHVIVGFTDTRDRLRTRIEQTNRSGVRIPPDFPLPAGPGGSRVTFNRIVFDKHLIGLEHNQIKEYVKIRNDASGTKETPEEAAINEKAAVKEAMRRAGTHPSSDNLPQPQIAYGVDLPDYVVNASRPEKKRRVGNSFGPTSFLPPDSNKAPHDTALQQTNGNLAPTGSPSVASAIQRSAIDLLPGTRPTKILLGYWRGSSEERFEDKHAVFGILGANDMFRVKVTRETRDGRPVLGNFPQGAGALWIHYDEVEFEKHIRHLSRPEVKEYVRVRQRQLDEGEKPSDRVTNEVAAVYEAQSRVINAGGAAQSTLGTSGRVDTISFATAAHLNREVHRVADVYRATPEKADKNGGSYQAPTQDSRPRRESSGHENRRSRRGTMDSQDAPSSVSAAAVVDPSTPHEARSGRHSLPDSAGVPAEQRTAGRPPTASNESNEGGRNPNADRVERTNSIARREISRMESLQQRNEQRAANRDAGPANGANLPNIAATPIVPSQHANGTNSTTTNGGKSSRQTFNENINRLNKVWASQEATRLRAGDEDAKIFMGVKYERKQTGPFQGKLVSPGTILSIDGEDYVEYRVLTKPTFF